MATRKTEKPFRPRDHYTPAYWDPAHVRNRFSAYFVPQPAENNTYMHDPQFTLALKVKSEREGFAGVVG